MYRINPCVDDFTLNRENRCNLCDKVVRDLSEMSDTEVIAELNRSNGDLCGKGVASKFNQAYYLHPFKRFAFALLLVFGSSLFILDICAQDSIQKIKEVIDPVNESTENSLETVLFKGTVVDNETGEPLPFVSVYTTLNGVVFGVHSDFDGNFKLEIDKEQISSGEPLILTLSYAGFMPQKIAIEKLDEPITHVGTILIRSENLDIMVGIIIDDSKINIMDPDQHRSTVIKREEIKRSPKRQ